MGRNNEWEGDVMLGSLVVLRAGSVCSYFGEGLFACTPSNAQGLVTPGSVLMEHSWKAERAIWDAEDRTPSRLYARPALNPLDSVPLNNANIPSSLFSPSFL